MAAADPVVPSIMLSVHHDDEASDILVIKAEAAEPKGAIAKQSGASAKRRRSSDGEQPRT